MENFTTGIYLISLSIVPHLQEDKIFHNNEEFVEKTFLQWLYCNLFAGVTVILTSPGSKERREPNNIGML